MDVKLPNLGEGADTGTVVNLFVKEGDQIELIDVAGHGFDLDRLHGRDLVFVAMGTGVAPLRSALRHVLKRKGEFGQLVVLYGARTPDDFCYRDETDSWEDAGVELRQVISRPGDHDWSGPTGYVQSLLDHVLPNLKSPVALVCGSREMIDQLGEHVSGREITLRINPGFGHGHSQKTNTGGAQSKHGIWHDQLDDCLQRADRY